MAQLTLCSDPAPARWIVDSRTPFDQLILFGPDVFESSARLRFIPDPTSPGQDEADVVVEEGHPHELAQVQLALRQLEPFTGTSDDCFFCVWEGYSDVRIPPEATSASMVVLPHRRYTLFRGRLRSIDSFAAEFGCSGATTIAPPAFVWPADRRWCLARDVDPHWAGIGAQQEAVDALIADDSLDVVPAYPRDDQPLYY